MSIGTVKEALYQVFVNQDPEFEKNEVLHRNFLDILARAPVSVSLQTLQNRITTTQTSDITTHKLTLTHFHQILQNREDRKFLLNAPYKTLPLAGEKYKFTIGQLACYLGDHKILKDLIADINTNTECPYKSTLLHLLIQGIEDGMYETTVVDAAKLLIDHCPEMLSQKNALEATPKQYLLCLLLRGQQSIAEDFGHSPITSDQKTKLKEILEYMQQKTK